MDPLVLSNGVPLLLALGAALLGCAWPFQGPAPVPAPAPLATSVCAPCPACPACPACEVCWPNWALGIALGVGCGLSFAAGLCCACCGAATWFAYGPAPRNVTVFGSPERVAAGRSPAAAARLRLYN